MKQLITMIVTLSSCAFAQGAVDDCEARYAKWKELQQSEYLGSPPIPSMVGGLAALAQMINYPDSAITARIEGKVVVWTYVDTSGRVLCTKVLEGPGFGTEESVVSAIRKVTFIPPSSGGVKVASALLIPFRFKLNNK